MVNKKNNINNIIKKIKLINKIIYIFILKKIR